MGGFKLHKTEEDKEEEISEVSPIKLTSIGDIIDEARKSAIKDVRK